MRLTGTFFSPYTKSPCKQTLSNNAAGELMQCHCWKQITCLTNFIVNIISLLILINPTIWEMLLSYFLSHLDKVDASFVGFCVIHRYWPLVVSFAPLCKQGYLLHLVDIVTFCCTAQNTFVLRVFCAVQPKCHTDNVAWLLELSGTAQEEILLPIR